MDWLVDTYKVEQRGKASVVRDISYIAIVQEKMNKIVLEGAGQVELNIQHWARAVKVLQGGRQTLTPPE